MAVVDAALAWAYLSRSDEYRAAWVASAQAPEYEVGPIPLRIQNEHDLEAARFALLAWKDPDGTDGAASPFWTEAPMLSGDFVTDARPLLPLLAAAGVRIEGLRLGTGELVLKVERGDEVAQVRIENPGPFPAEAGLALSPEERERTGLMAPSHSLRERVNEIVRERLTRDGVVHGPAMATERLVSRGFTTAEKALARNYRAGDVVVRHRHSP